MPTITQTIVALSVFVITEQPEFVIPLLALFFWREYRRGQAKIGDSNV